MSDQKVMGADMIKSYTPKEGILVDIFRAQDRFGSKFCNFNALRPGTSGLVVGERHKWFQIFADCVLDECSEILGWLPWKHWKKYENFELNVLEMKFEMIDVLHFIVSQALLLKSAIDAKDWLDLEEQDELEARLVELYANAVRSTKSKLMSQEDRIQATRTLLRRLQGSAALMYQSNEPYKVIKSEFEILFTMFAIWDMDAQEIFNMYMSKNQENFDRQGRGY